MRIETVSAAVTIGDKNHPTALMLDMPAVTGSPNTTPGTLTVVSWLMPLARLGMSSVAVAVMNLVTVLPLPTATVVAVNALAASVGLLTVVVPPLADPTFTFVVEPAAPPVATLTVLVVALAVALVL